MFIFLDRLVECLARHEFFKIYVIPLPYIKMYITYFGMFFLILAGSSISNDDIR